MRQFIKIDYIMYALICIQQNLLSIFKIYLMKLNNKAHFQYPLKGLNREEWNRKVAATAMFSIPAEDEALPILIQLIEVLQNLLSKPLQQVIDKSQIPYFFTEFFPVICQKIVKSRYFKNTTVLKLSNQILQNCVYLFPKYISIAETYPKFLQVLTNVLCSDQYYFKTNNQTDHRVYPYMYFPDAKNNISEPLKQGDLIDAIKFSSMYEKLVWSRAKIIKIQEQDIQVIFLNDMNNFTTTFNVLSPLIAPYQTKSKDFQWRLGLKVGDLVDCEDNFGSWYNGTIINAEQKEDGKKMVTITFKVYHQNGTKSDENGKFFGFSDYTQKMDVTSPKLQRYCTVCKQRSYESSKNSYDSIDDLNDNEFEQIGGMRIYAFPRRKFLSDFLFKTINVFGELGGFEKPLQILQSGINFEFLCWYVKAVSGITPYLHKNLVIQFIKRIKPIIENHIFNDSQAVNKFFTKQKSQMLFSGLKALQKRIFSIQDVYQYENSQKMKLVDKCLQSQTLKKKLQGLNELKDIIKSVTSSSQRNKKIKAWVKDMKLFQKIYIVNSHAQLIKKSEDFFRYLINQSILQVTELKSLYRMAQKGDYQSRISLYKLFIEVSHIFKRPHVDFLIDTILQSDINLVLNQDIDLLYELSKFSNYFPMQKVIPFFQKLVLGQNPDSETNEYAIKKYSDIVARSFEMRPYRKQVIRSFLQKLNTEYVSKVTRILKGIFEGIGIGEWGKKDLNEIQQEEKIDNIILQVIKNNKQSPIWPKMVSQVLNFLLFIYKLSYRVKIHIKILKSIWDEISENDEKKIEFYKWANQVFKCDQDIQDDTNSGQLEAFFNVLFNEESLPNLTQSQLQLAKNFFVEINKKCRLLEVSHTIRERDNPAEKQYKRKVSMKMLKNPNFLLKLIFQVEKMQIAQQAIKFFLAIYSSKDNNQEQIHAFLQELLADLKKYYSAKSSINIKKTLKLLQILLDDSEKIYEAKVDSLLSRKKAQLLKLIVINETSYLSDHPKKIDLTVPQNYSLLDLRKRLARQFNLTWQQIRIVSKFQLPDLFNSRYLKQLRLNPSDPLTVSKRVVNTHIQSDFFNDEHKTQMHPRAIRVFKVIFDDHSTNGLMSKQQSNIFTSHCLGTDPKHKFYNDKIHSLYSKYDTDQDGYLTFQNFLAFYTQSARDRASTVWSNLKSFGVRGDFKFSHQPTDEIDQTRLPRIILGENEQFYQILFDLISSPDNAYLAYNLLQRLPISKSVESQVHNITAENIKQALGSKKLYVLFYKLNIIQCLIESSEKSENQRTWVNKFRQIGGFEVLFKTFKQIASETVLIDIQRQIINTILIMLHTHFMNCFADKTVLTADSLLISDIDIDDKIEYLVTGLFPKTQQRLQQRHFQKLYQWNGSQKRQIIKQFIDLLKRLWTQTENQYMRDNLINKLIDSLLILLIYQCPIDLTQNLSFLLMKVPSPRLMRKLYCLILCDCFYSQEYQAMYIKELFKHLTTQSITSQHFRVLAVLVSKFGATQVGGGQMENILLQNILNQNNELTVEGCARLLTNFTLMDFTYEKFENIWQKCLFGNRASCTKQQTRNQLYQLILKICDSKKQMTNQILEKTVTTLQSSIQNMKITSCSEINQRSATGFVGLKNLGNICYMNSFLQQLYMNQTFRYLLLRINDKKQQNLVEYRQKLVDDNVLHQVQRAFAFLEETTRVDYVPLGFCGAYKIYGEPVNVMIQQDVQEFISMFFDSLEICIKDTSLKRLVDNFYVGKNLNMFNCHQCKQTKKVEENFYSISVDVKNSKTLAQSFNRHISGQLINEYKCDFCGQKADVTKFTRISQSPKILIIHLQRIVFSLDTFINQKITTKHQFPMQFNLHPYTLQHYQEKQKAQKKESIQSSPEKQDFDYALTGIICHIGNAQAGHYISYIKNASGKWFQFNDSIVSVFNPANIEAQCFGGGMSVYDQQYDWDKQSSSKSAYILLYEKKGQNNIQLVLDNLEKKDAILKELNLQQLNKVIASFKEQQQTESQDESSSKVGDSENDDLKQKREQQEILQIQMIKKQKSQDNIRIEEVMKPYTKQQVNVVAVKDNVSTFIPPKLHEQVEKDNLVHFFERSVGSPAFPKFFAQLLTRDHDKHHQVLPLLKKLAFGFWLKSPNFKILLNSLSHFIRAFPYGIKEIVLQNQQVLTLFIQNSDGDIRSNISQFLAQSLKDVIQLQKLTLEGQGQLDKSIVAFLDRLLNMLPNNVSKCWTKFSQYFEFWCDFAKISQQTFKYMAKRDFIMHFLDYFLDKKSPLQIYANKQHAIGNKYVAPNFSPLLKCVTYLIQKHLESSSQFKLTQKDYLLLLHFDCLQKLISDTHQSIAAAVAKQICKNNLYASEKVAIVLQKGLCKSTFDNVQPYLDVLHQFMMIEDEYQNLRMKWVIGKQTLAVSTISKNITAMNSYSMQERIYQFDSTLQIEQGSPLLDPIFTFHRKVQNFSILCLREVLRLSDQSEKIRNYIFSLNSPTINQSRFVDFFEQFINKYIQDSKRMYGHHSAGFNKQELGKEIKEIYEKVMKKVNEELKITQAKQKLLIKKSKSKDSKKSEKKIKVQPIQRSLQIEQEKTKLQPVDIQLNQHTKIEDKQKINQQKAQECHQTKQQIQSKPQKQAKDNQEQSWSADDKNENDNYQMQQKIIITEPKTTRQNHHRAWNQPGFQQSDQQPDLAKKQSSDGQQIYKSGAFQSKFRQDYPMDNVGYQDQERFYTSQQQQQVKTTQPQTNQLSKYPEVYHPVKFSYHQISSQQKMGLLICRHQSQVTYVLTKPTGSSNKSFISVMTGQKLIERLQKNAWETAKTEIVKGFYIINTTRDQIRIKTEEGTSLIRANDSAFVWCNQILDIWQTERAVGWPKWTLYAIDDSNKKVQEHNSPSK